MLRKLEIEILISGGVILRQHAEADARMDHRISTGKTIEVHAQFYDDDRYESLSLEIKRILAKIRTEFPL